tara:strand:- start:23 stop:181 length:159 start_codon:yes stop_codon:yes gene_type:complete
MITYETRQDGDSTFATFTKDDTYFEVPIASEQTEDEIQAEIQLTIDYHAFTE